MGNNNNNNNNNANPGAAGNQPNQGQNASNDPLGFNNISNGEILEKN